MELQIENYIKNKTSLSIAHRYEQYDNVVLLDICDLGNHYEIHGAVDVLGRIYDVFFVLDKSGKLSEYNCNCSYCDSDPCAHIGAVMLKINQLDIDHFPYHYEKDLEHEILEERKKSAERRESAHLMEMTSMGRKIMEMRKMDYQRQLDRIITNERYEIEASLNEGYGHHLSLTFKIGNEKKYVIKNISLFLEMMNHHTFHTYGKQLSMTHQIESFDELGQKQIHFMEEMERRLRKKEYYYTSQLGRSINLDNDNIDDFFYVYEDAGGSNFSCQREEKKIELRWQEKSKYDELSLVTDLSSYICGNRNLYMLDHSKNSYEFHCIVLDDQGRAIDLIKQLLLHPIWILKEERNEFYKYVLDNLTDYFDIMNLFELPNSQLEKIKIFGDINDEGDVVVNVEYLYEDQHHSMGLTNENLLTYEQDLVESYIRKYASGIQEGVAVFDSNEENTLSFVEEGFTFLQNYGDVYISESLKKFNEHKMYRINVGVRYESDLLSIDIQSEDLPKDEISSILSQYRRKKKFYRLKNGELIHLNSPAIEELSGIMDDFHLDVKDIANGEFALNPYRLFAVEQEANASKNIVFERSRSFKNALEHFTVQAIDEMKIPSQYEDILREYQKEGVKWMQLLNSYHFNGILADDMGLGKTLQVIALIEGLQTELPCIVVAPSSLVYNWMDEVEKFSKQLRAICIVGNQENRRHLLEEKADLYITSYDYMRRDGELYEDKQFEYVILDEAQYIKNQKTQNAISVKKLKANHKLALTGTPIENSLAELWSIFDFLMPGYLFNYHYFLNHYENDIVRNDDEEKKKKLKQLVTPFILRRNKKEVLQELPDKIEKVQLIDFSEEENKLYLAHLASVNKELNAMMGNEKVDKIAVLAMLTKLRQICCEPRLLFDNIYDSSSKMKACMDLVVNLKENSQKVLIFSSFTSVLDLIERELNLLNISSYKLTGQTSKEERRELIQKFQSDDTEVFLISLKAGGTGLNLTAAQAVIHFDPWWNISAQNQATDRAYRIGQEKNVQVFKLVMKNSIEEKILKLQEKKKDLADSFVENNEGSLSKMDKDDIMELFKI